MLLSQKFILFYLFQYCFPKKSCDEAIGNRLQDGVHVTHDKINDQKHQQVDTAHPPPPGHLKKLGEHAIPIRDEIPVLDYMISGADFYEHFIHKRQPVLLRNVTHDWLATKHWRNESYLLDKYSDVLFDVKMHRIYNQSSIPLIPRQTMYFKDFLMSYKNKTLYLDSPFPQSPLMHDLEIPLMMQCESILEAFLNIDLLFSNGDTSSPLHVDGGENFLTVFSGKKVVYAFAPQYIDNLYMNENTEFPSFSPINPERVDLVKFARFHGTPFHEVTLNAGDMLYIPIGWFHQVRSYQSPNIAVSMWFMSFSIENENVDDNNMKGEEEMLQRVISKLPSTIACRHQNVPLKSLTQLHALKQKNRLEKASQQKQNKEERIELVEETILFNEIGVNDGAIFVVSNDTYIYAIDINNGDIHWKVKTTQNTGFTCAFNNDETLIYCGMGDGYMIAVVVTNGDVVWNIKVGKKCISSLVVDTNDMIYTTSLDGQIQCFYKNGTIKWRRGLKAKIRSSPVIVVDVNILYIATTGDYQTNTFALDIDSGKIIWKRRSLGGVSSTIRVLKENGYVIVCTHFADVIIYKGLDGSLVKTVALSETDGISSSPAVDKTNKLLFVLLNSGRLVAISLDNDEIIWELFTGKCANYDANSSPIVAPEGMLYVGGVNGTFYAINSITSDVQWKIDIRKTIFFSSPRLDKDGVIYIGSGDGGLYALNSNNGDVKWTAKTVGPIVRTVLIPKKSIS